MIAGMKKQLAILLSALLIAMALPAHALAATQTGQQSQSGVKNVSVELNAKKAKAGWKKVGKKWKYRTSSGKYLKSCFKTIKGKKYRFNSKGYRCTGWITVKGKKYYANSKGVIAKGWRTIKGKRYYFSKSTGALQTNKSTTPSNSSSSQTVDNYIVGTWYVVAVTTTGADGLGFVRKSTSSHLSVYRDGSYILIIQGEVLTTGNWRFYKTVDGSRYYIFKNSVTGTDFWFTGVNSNGTCSMIQMNDSDIALILER